LFKIISLGAVSPYAASKQRHIMEPEQEQELTKAAPSNKSGGRRRARWWIAGLIVALAAANIARVQWSGDLEGNFRSMQTFLTIPVALVLLLLWLLFLSGFRWRIRLASLGVVALLVVGLTQLVRFDGTADGTGRVRLAWKWAAKKGVTGALRLSGRAGATADTGAGSPGFLGQDRRGAIAQSQWEKDWKAHPPKPLWRQPVGLGWSSFAVDGSKVLTQEQRGDEELVVCYEIVSGQAIWAHTNHARFSEPLGGDGPRATPTIASGRVYALGATGILDCLDENTGRLIWSRDTLKENGLPNLLWAKSCSPLLVEELVVVSGGMTNVDTLLAYRNEDGSPAWRAGKDKASYSSPLVATLAGKRQIVSLNAGSVTGHDIKDGHILWEYPWGTDKWPKCAQPVALDGERLFVSAGYGLGCVLLQLKCDPKDSMSVSEVWKSRSMKSQFSNMVVRDGFLYGLDDGILACVDLASGGRKWKGGRYGHGQVLLVDDMLLVQTEPGAIVLVDANPSQYREVAKLDALSSKTWNAPAIAGEFLLTRNDQEAVCYRLALRSGH
jgi:outer membrane protein assembly factor BamB